jgi:hypothetical protein
MPVCLLVLSLLSAAPAAPFEGDLHFELSGPMTGKIRMTLAKSGSRVSMELKGPLPSRSTILGNPATPDKATVLDDVFKSYTEVDIGPLRRQMPPDPAYQVTKVGEGKLNGFNVTHVKVSAENGYEHELWVTKSLNVDDFKVPGNPSAPEGVRKAVASAGFEGFPVKHVQHLKSPPGTTLTLELKKVHAHPVPASTFKIPKGYSLKTTITPPLAQLPPASNQAPPPPAAPPPTTGNAPPPSATPKANTNAPPQPK